jgi:hypothetical protein
MRGPDTVSDMVYTEEMANEEVELFRVGRSSVKGKSRV